MFVLLNGVKEHAINILCVGHIESNALILNMILYWIKEMFQHFIRFFFHSIGFEIFGNSNKSLSVCKTFLFNQTCNRVSSIEKSKPFSQNGTVK